MSENILTVSRDNGETATIPFAELSNGESELSTNSLRDFAQAHPKVANLTIKFPKGVYGDLDAMVIALDRAEKTLGTYVTRANKIMSGIDPNTRAHRSGSASSSAGKKANIGIAMLGKDSVRLFTVDGELEAEVKTTGEVSTNDFDTFEYFITAVLHPVQWANRISMLRQFADGKEATPPSYTLSFEGVSVDLGSAKPDEQAVLKAQAEIAGKLIQQGVFPDGAKLKNAKPQMTGGGEEWLNAWLEQAYPEQYQEQAKEVEPEQA